MKIYPRQGKFEVISVNYSARSKGIIGISFLRIFKTILISTHNIKKRESPEIISNLQLWDFVPRDSRWKDGVRNSRGKRAISVRAIEVLLYIYLSEAPGNTTGEGVTATCGGANVQIACPWLQPPQMPAKMQTAHTTRTTSTTIHRYILIK